MSAVEEKRIFFVIGEESGDVLGADLIDALEKKAAEAGISIKPIGLAGEHMRARGMNSLFDISDIAVMGITAVLGRLPTLIKRVLATVSAIVEQKPDIVVLIDSPDFTHAVAKRVRKKCPHMPIINYVCPSVWAWRQGRARRMAAYVDHVLALLPFEPAVLAELKGPPATYVGHQLVNEMADLIHPPNHQLPVEDPTSKPVLLVLPGSRRGEIKSLLNTFGETVEFLHQRGMQFTCIIPAVNALADEISQKTRHWAVRPEVVIGSEAKFAAFGKATAALAVSGTISLELALAGVPMVLAYKLDLIARPLMFVVKAWSPALPNLVADYIIVPEELNEAAVKERLARRLERLLVDTPERRAQIEGLALVAQKMQVDQPPGEKAALIVLSHLPGVR